VSEAPDLGEAESTPGARAVACHRADPNHHYWSSEPLEGVDVSESPGVED
jgi:peptide/nickel transport system ATP-binding protein